MKRLGWLLGFCCWLALGAIAGSASESGLTVTIAETAVVAGPRIHLGDLGSIDGATESDRKALSAIDLGSAPPPGQIKTITRDYLRFLLTNRFTIPPVLAMGPAVRVQVEAKCITDADLVAAAERILSAKPGIRQHIELKNAPKQTWLSPADWQITVEPMGELPIVGSVLFRVTLTGGPEAKVLHLSGKVRAWGRLYRVQREIAKHSAIQPDDLEVIEAELVYGDELLAEPVGLRPIRPLASGTLLRSKQLQPIPLVAKGSAVTVIARGQGLEIALTGIAGADGWEGDLIPIYNPTSRKTFKAMVSMPNTVEVAFR
jgi:flagella basal body P-ring formation protein FlgA